MKTIFAFLCFLNLFISTAHSSGHVGRDVRPGMKFILLRELVVEENPFTLYSFPASHWKNSESCQLFVKNLPSAGIVVQQNTVSAVRRVEFTRGSESGPHRIMILFAGSDFEGMNCQFATDKFNSTDYTAFKEYLEALGFFRIEAY